MSNLAQFVGGYGPIASIVNYYSAGGVVSATQISSGPVSNLKEYLPGVGSVAANTLSTVYSYSGRGRLNACSGYVKDTTSRTVRLQVIIDGVTVFDATSSTTTTNNTGVVALGVFDSGGAIQQFQPVDFYTSCVVKVASSLTETDKVAAGIAVETWS